MVNQEQAVDRRSGHDRRKGFDRRSGSDRRQLVLPEGQALKPTEPYAFPTVDERRSGKDRRAGWMARAAANDQSQSADVRPWLGLRQAERALGLSLDEVLQRLNGAIMELVALFYDAGVDARRWPEALAQLADAFNADVCAIASHDYASAVGKLDHSVHFDRSFAEAYAGLYSRLDVWLQREDQFRVPGTVSLSQQLVPEEQVTDTKFFREWLRPQDLLHHLFGVLDRRDNHLTYLLLGRSAGKPTFNEADASLLRRLLPSLQRGLRTSRSFAGAQEIRRIALDSLDALPIGVILLNSAGGIVAANRIARETLKAEDVLFVGSGGLTVDLAGGRFRFRDFVSTNQPGGGGEQSGEARAFAVPRPASGRRPLTVLLAPLGSKSEAASQDEPVAIAFIGDPDRTIEMDQRRLCRLYGLSRAEARVAALLAQGQRLDQAAETLGLTYETVRKHLKQVFGKTGTDRQAELMRILVTGPAGLRL